MDIELNDELINEGLAREVVNRIQKTRKDLNLNVSDRIKVQYLADEKLANVLSEHHDYIAGETLATELASVDASGQHNFDIDGHSLSITIEKLN